MSEQPPPTPPGLSSLFYSFTRAFSLSSPPRHQTKSFAASLDFDAGINTSAAWTEHRERESMLSFTAVPPSLSDDEGDGDEDDAANLDNRSARVLHKFEGKPEFRELSVDAGDEIEIVREDAGDGWSLVRNTVGELGLLPQTYYTFIVDFVNAPATIPRLSRFVRRREASNQSLTPRGSPRGSRYDPIQDPGPIVVQTTGERMLAAFPSFRHSLLGGKALNRFSSFVTSGAEAYVLKGASTAETSRSISIHGRASSDDSDPGDEEEPDDGAKTCWRGSNEADRHFVDAGPSWRAKVPPFRVLVHSPAKRSSSLSGPFTIYSVTSLFHLPSAGDEEQQDAGSDAHAKRITVQRRFSHFVVLHTALTRRLPGIALPPLPEKQYAGRFNDDFVEARRGDLERYLAKVVRHPVARYAEILTFFLGCESDLEWKRQLPQHLSLPPAGPSFYANVFHPEFNLDAEETGEIADRFQAHTKEVGKGTQVLRNVFGGARQARVEMSKADRMLSYSLLSLVTGKLVASVHDEYDEDEEETEDPAEAARRKLKKGKGVLNEEGAWCWREGCKQCLRLTKALVKTGETLQSVADLYDDHARRTQLHTHDMLKVVAHPFSIYAPVVDTHRNALTRYAEASQREQQAGEDVAARCETVLNTTMAEMEIYHTQKVEDFTNIAIEHLDGEIEFYEQVLSRLRAARRTFDPPTYDYLSKGARQPSIYERELEKPRLDPEPLPQPCPHVYDSTPMRPVSHAIQKGVSLFLGSGVGRTSVFGQFW
ncbi:hypothetical protein K488DRAFT_43230 [Vararia minispora EC-137]|uniref:Uncharacterized protein n=1 Tax=Vararia minispora EC-137 TaxID=1314806 RepID=A0ACB8QV02_9AGAM|nr:hypothetical protein K488DRAFT_43230 [Vararia minispora EC-137]